MDFGEKLAEERKALDAQLSAAGITDPDLVNQAVRYFERSRMSAAARGLGSMMGADADAKRITKQVQALQQERQKVAAWLK